MVSEGCLSTICMAGSFVSAGGQQGMPDPLFTAVGSGSSETGE